jgi:flagellar hook protein FlgE
MSFQQGLSGLSAAAKNLEVIGNNISNANTIGAKSSRAEFSDLYANAVGGGGSVGIGTSLAAVTQDHTQGSITTTGSNLDLAINGNGYFQLKEPSGAGGEKKVDLLFSRNGQFKTDREGFIVNNSGMRLQGYPADATGAILKGELQSFRVPDLSLPQKATTDIKIGLNLDGEDTIKSAPFDKEDGSSFNYSSSVKVYDEGGKSVDLSFFFRKSGVDTWDVYVTANDEYVPQVAAGAEPTVVETIEFTGSDGSGPPDPAFFTVNDAELAATLNTADMTAKGLSYSFGNINIDVSGATQRAGEYAISSVSQDGYGIGSLSGFSFDKDGILTARYTNGELRQQGQLALATFRNPQGLQPVGGNAWIESRESGQAVPNVPGSGNLGEIVAGALEESNVDLTAELVNLITAQRTYQANAQTIKTQDQVTQTFLNMR